MMSEFAINFRRDTQGVAAIIFAIMATVICLTVGAGVDFQRYSQARSVTGSALDSAVLAGATVLWRGGSHNDAIAAAQRYYADNIVNRFDVASDTVAFSIVDQGTAITASGNIEIETSFLQLGGIEKMALFSNPAADFPIAKVSSGGGDIEVALMLDVTGSMCGDGVGPCTDGTKMAAMKTAAKDLINYVVRDNQSQETSRVALVPFSKRIRVAPNGAGDSIMKAMTNLDPTWSGWYNVCHNYTIAGSSEDGDDYDCDDEQSEQVTNWKIIPCVTDRFYDASWSIDATDDAPGIGRWINANGGQRYPVSVDSADTPPSDKLGLDASDPAEHYNWDENGYCSTDEANQIVPLSSDKIDLKAKIDALVGEKATGGALGTAFSWYMLSPNWSSIWPSASAPGPYSDLTALLPNGMPKLRKIAILMSDGVYNTYRGWDKKDQQESSDFAVQLCTAMKSAGIEVYTVGFDLDALSSAARSIAEATLQSCGTDVDHFYNTLDPNELKDAFRDIATKLGSVSLVR